MPEKKITTEKDNYVFGKVFWDEIQSIDYNNRMKQLNFDSFL